VVLSGVLLQAIRGRAVEDGPARRKSASERKEWEIALSPGLQVDPENQNQNVK
jgi:hypothetical protein